MENSGSNNTVEFSDLMNCIVYHANIFNYDKQFLTKLASKAVQFDFSRFDAEKKSKSAEDLKEFLNKNSPENQIKSLTALLHKTILCDIEENSGNYSINTDDNNRSELNSEAQKSQIKMAKKALRGLFDLLRFSLSNSETENDNIIASLLYIDGVSMIKPELVNIFLRLAGDGDMNLPQIVFLILDNSDYDFHVQEIASHILSIAIMSGQSTWNPEIDGDLNTNFKRLMKKTHENFAAHSRTSCLTSNFCLLLTNEEVVEYFVKEFNKENQVLRRLFDIITSGDTNINIIYETLFCMWNISNIKEYFYLFEDLDKNYIEKIVQVIRTNKIDKIARIGLMIIKNLLESSICVEILFDIKFKKTITILLTNKWNDSTIKNLLDEIFDFLEKNYKSVNSFEKYMKEIDSGKLKKGSLHSKEFWEDNYRNFEYSGFEYIRRLVSILKDQSSDPSQVEQLCLACFDLGEFARLYPGGAGVLEVFKAKEVLMSLIKHNDMNLKNRALVCLQKIMMRSLKK